MLLPKSVLLQRAFKSIVEPGAGRQETPLAILAVELAENHRGFDRVVKLRLARLAYPVTALGPGSRLALWVAGCPLRCRGCITPDLWRQDAGWEVTVERLLDRILALQPPLDGITVSGGEPFEQAAPLARLLARLAIARSHWNTLLFSGYPLATLKNRGTDAADLLALTDVLIAGPYDRRQPAVHPLAGSGNQRLHYLSPRGRSLQSELDAMPFNRADLALGTGHQQLLIGVIAPAARRRIHQLLTTAKTPRED